MADLIFADSHNMVAYLEKSEDNADFAEIVDFLNASPIRFALTVSPTVYVSYIEQFWSTTKIKTVNNETQIRAKVDGKTIVITESSVRRDLHFNDEDGTTCLTNTEICENLQLMGPNPYCCIIISTQKHRKTKRKATEISQSSGPTTLVAFETIDEERGDSVERAATIATSLDAEQGISNINRTQSTATLKDLISQGTGSGSGPRRQDTMGDRPAQTSMKLQDLMDLYTKLSDKVLDLKNVKDAQALEIKKLKKGVKKLESKKKSRTSQLKRRLFKVRIESSAEKSLGDQEDSSKQGRNEIDQDEGIACIVEPSTPPPTTTTPIEDEDLTIAQTLMKMKSEKSKAKKVTMQEPSESGTRVRVPPLQIDPKDKGKAKMVKPKKPNKKKDQIEYDADVAQRLQAELDEESRLEREREEEASKAANITKWDDVQAMMDADYELATKLQEQEREELTIE
ncbi:hypothetical protein Tco_1555053 [Tanacetum coccineum]